MDYLFEGLFAVGMLTAIVTVPFVLVSANAGAFGWWIAVTISSMLTAPYAAHALTVVYYTLSEPQRPVILDPGHRWGSVWDEEHAETDESASVDEYQRRFDEHEQRWGDNS